MMGVGKERDRAAVAMEQALSFLGKRYSRLSRAGVVSYNSCALSFKELPEQRSKLKKGWRGRYPEVFLFWLGLKKADSRKRRRSFGR